MPLHPAQRNSTLFLPILQILLIIFFKIVEKPFMTTSDTHQYCSKTRFLHFKAKGFVFFHPLSAIYFKKASTVVAPFLHNGAGFFLMQSYHVLHRLCGYQPPKWAFLCEYPAKRSLRLEQIAPFSGFFCCKVFQLFLRIWA